MRPIKTYNSRRYKNIYGMSKTGGRHFKLPRYRLREIKKNRMKRRRSIESAVKWLSKNPYYEDCSYVPVKLVDYEYYSGDYSLDLFGENMLTHTQGSCSYQHCGVLLLTEDEANERVDYIKKYGMYPYQLKYIHKVPLERIVEYITSSLEMEKVWGFSKRQQIALFTDAGKQLFQDEYNIVVDNLISEY